MRRGAVAAAFFVLATALTFSTRANNNSNDPATKFLREVCRADYDGARFTAEGQKRFAEYFAHGTVSPPKRFIVVDGCVYIGQSAGDRAEGYLEYIYIGQLTPDLNYTDPDLGDGMNGQGMKVRIGVEMVRHNGTWQITDEQFEPHVGIDAAMKYVEQVRASTNDPKLQRRATTALARLRRQQ